MLISLILNFVALTGLCLAMPKHHRDLLGYVPSTRRRTLFRLGGVGALVLAMAVSVTEGGWAIGLIQWFGLLTVAGLLLVFALPYVSPVRSDRHAR